jgi:hypothetical protein
MIAVPLGQPDGLARPLAEVIQFCASCLAASDRPDIQDVRRMQRENAFHTLVIDDPPDREALVNAPAFAGNYRAGKDLRAFLIAFLYAAVNIDYIAYLEMRDLFLQTFALNGVQKFRFHLSISYVSTKHQTTKPRILAVWCPQSKRFFQICGSLEFARMKIVCNQKAIMLYSAL